MTTVIALALALSAAPARPAWFTVLQDGLDEAKRTNRPILLLSAAPQCAEVPGDW
jgi:hypothetical protein